MRHALAVLAGAAEQGILWRRTTWAQALAVLAAGPDSYVYSGDQLDHMERSAYDLGYEDGTAQYRLCGRGEYRSADGTVRSIWYGSV